MRSRDSDARHCWKAGYGLRRGHTPGCLQAARRLCIWATTTRCPCLEQALGGKDKGESIAESNPIQQSILRHVQDLHKLTPAVAQSDDNVFRSGPDHQVLEDDPWEYHPGRADHSPW